jgi:hypothetical protein
VDAAIDLLLPPSRASGSRKLEARERSERRTRARHAKWHARRGVPQPNLPLVPDERSARLRMVSHGDSRCASRTEQPRPPYCRRTLHRDSPRRRHICAGTGRTAATSVPGLCFEWPSSRRSAASARTMRRRQCESFDLHRGSVKLAGGAGGLCSISAAHGGGRSRRGVAALAGERGVARLAVQPVSPRCMLRVAPCSLRSSRSASSAASSPLNVVCYARACVSACFCESMCAETGEWREAGGGEGSLRLRVYVRLVWVGCVRDIAALWWASACVGVCVYIPVRVCACGSICEWE